MSMNGTKYLCQLLTQESSIHQESSGPFYIHPTSAKKPNFLGICGRWTTDENTRFVAFLTKFDKELESLKGKKRWGYFSLMSDFVKTRNTNQCRSYFNKLMKRFGSIQKIIAKLRQVVTGVNEALNDLQNSVMKMEGKFQEILNFKNIVDEKQLPNDGNHKENELQNYRTGTQYQNQPEIPHQPTQKYYSMPENLFKLFYFDLWSIQNSHNMVGIQQKNEGRNVSESLADWKLDQCEMIDLF